MSDPIKNLEFQFNSLNLLDNVKKYGAMKARYIWGADGSKRAVADAAASNGFEYFGSFVFTKTSSGLESESAAFPEGRFMAASAISQGGSFSPIFHVTDHLGSVRADLIMKIKFSKRHHKAHFTKLSIFTVIYNIK